MVTEEQMATFLRVVKDHEPPADGGHIIPLAIRDEWRRLAHEIMGDRLTSEEIADRVMEVADAAIALVGSWDEHPCPSCGGTGVAWDWPEAAALRAAVKRYTLR